MIYSLNIDIDKDPRSSIMLSPTDGTPSALPSLVFGDNLPFEISFYRSGLLASESGTGSLMVSLGQPGGSVYAFQDTFATVDNSWTGSLNLATVGLQTALGFSDYAEMTFEVKYTSPLTLKTITYVHSPVFVFNRVDTSSFYATGLPQYLTVSQSDARYLKYGDAITGSGWTINGNYLYTSNDTYSVGLGVHVPSERLDVAGNIKSSGIVYASTVIAPTLYGTASRALTASLATFSTAARSASFASSSASSSYALNASLASTASYATYATAAYTSTYANYADSATNADSASLASVSLQSRTASYVKNGSSRIDLTNSQVNVTAPSGVTLSAGAQLTLQTNAVSSPVIIQTSADSADIQLVTDAGNSNILIGTGDPTSNVEIYAGKDVLITQAKITGSLFGSASYALSSSYAATWDSASLIQWISSLMKSTTYYLSNTGSGVSDFFVMKETGSNASVTTLSNTASNNTYPVSWISPLGSPATQILPEGLYHIDIMARKAAFPNTLQVTPEIYLMNTASVLYYELPAGQISPALTTTFTRYELNIINSTPITCSVQDRLVVRLKATSTGTPTLECQSEGNVLSHFGTPIPAGVYSSALASISASYSLSSSYARTASYANFATSASYSSYIYYNVTQSLTNILSASWASSSYSASYAPPNVGTPRVVFGDKSVSLTTSSYNTVLTVNMSPSSSAYLKLSMHGNWDGNGTGLNVAEFVLIKDGLSTFKQPGAILQNINYNNNSWQMRPMIVDPGASAGNANMLVQYKLDGDKTSSFQLLYELRGIFNSVT